MPYLPIDSPTSSNPDARDVGSGYPSGLALLAQLVEHLHGKEGVDGSSPSEGFAKAAQTAAFSVDPACTSSSMRWIWSRLWSFQVRGVYGSPGEELAALAPTQVTRGRRYSSSFTVDDLVLRRSLRRERAT